MLALAAPKEKRLDNEQEGNILAGNKIVSQLLVNEGKRQPLLLYAPATDLPNGNVLLKAANVADEMHTLVELKDDRTLLPVGSG